jgi:hypothetical protein
MVRIARIALLCAAVSGCGSGSAPHDGGPDSDVVSCQNDPRVDTYVANLTKKPVSGTYQITLMNGDPAPPAIGVNTWQIKAEDATGSPMTDLNVVPFMPDHGHGTSVKAAITAQPDGTLSVTPLYLFMGGVWRVEFNPASRTDPVDFYFCIDG